MTDEELHARMKAWAMGWKEIGEYLEAERRERVRNSETLGFRAFNGMALWEAKCRPPEPTSGLVEQQRIFLKAIQR